MKGFSRTRNPQYLSSRDWQRRQQVMDTFRNLLLMHGYGPMDAPVVEDTELFLRKSGGELAAKMYSFTDPGGNRVSLRPEFTSSVVRAYLEGNLDGRFPLRVQYGGPVFRYEIDKGTSYREVTQVGAEMLGVEGARADAEIAALGCLFLAQIGLTEQKLVLGDIGAVNCLLEQIGLSERGRVFLLASLPQLRVGEAGKAEVRRQACDLQLLESGDEARQVNPEELRGLGDKDALELVQRILKDSVSGSLGSREPEEIFERFLRKLRGVDSPHRVESGLNLLSRLAQLHGDPAMVMNEATAVVLEAGLDPAPLQGLVSVVEHLSSYALQGVSVELDFGLARGIAYYTGIVFEVQHRSIEGPPSLCGGGRYDGLARALGGKEDVPALGFACTIERVFEAVSAEGARPSVGASMATLLVAASVPEAYDAAVKVAFERRGKGTPVEMDVCGRSLEENLSYARAKGLSEVWVVKEDGSVARHVVKDGAL